MRPMSGNSLVARPAVRSRCPTSVCRWLAHSCGLRREIADTHEVVDRRRKGKQPIDSPRPAVPQFPHQPHGLEPSKHLFDELALALTHKVAGVARGAAIDRTRTIRRVL